MAWHWRKEPTPDRLAEEVVRLVLRELQPMVDEVRSATTAVREAASQAKSVAGAPSENIVTRLIDANEKLSTRFQELWMNEREAMREQRRAARASLTKKLAKEASETVEQEPPPPVIPEAFGACEECVATLESRAPAHNSDLLKHAQHKQEFWNWLQLSHANPTATAPNGHR